MRTYSEIISEIKTNYIGNDVVRSRYGITDLAATFDGTFSRFSIESIWAGVIAMSLYTIEFLFSAHLAEVNSREDQMRVGTVDWWRRICKGFQLGDALEYNTQTGIFEYPELNESAKIIKFSEVREGVGAGLLVLVSQADANGDPEPLPADSTRIAFDNYLKKIKIAGMPITWGSYNPDKLKISLNIRYNPLVMNSLGVILLGSEITIEDKIKDYLRNLPYGSGVANKTQIIDAVQSAVGVIDVYYTTSNWLQVSTFSVPSYTAIITRDITSYGGAFVLDELNINYHV